MIKILIVDDHAVVRRGIRQIIDEIPDVAEIDEAESGREALKKINRNAYDMVLLDIAMPGEGGFEILRQIKIYNPDLPVLILSMYPEEHFVYRALRSGASGYVTKENSPDELVDAIKKVFRGEKYLSSEFADSLFPDKEHFQDQHPHERLSDREFQVMCMMASGKAVSEIADELFLSVKTVSTHRANILEKMKMRNNAEITHYAIKEGLVK